MNKTDEYLLYANQCCLMAESSLRADEQVAWRNLAKLWLDRARKEAEADAGPAEQPSKLNTIMDLK